MEWGYEVSEESHVLGFQGYGTNSHKFINDFLFPEGSEKKLVCDLGHLL